MANLNKKRWGKRMGDGFTAGRRERRVREGRRAWVSRLKESGEERGAMYL